MLLEIWRHTFPKGLRFCRQCVILHAQIDSLTKRHKFKKYIPRREIMDVVEAYQRVPYRIMLLPFFRTVCMTRLLNGFRTYRGHPSWLTSRHAEIEHGRFAKWVALNCRTQYVERERFQREVLDVFPVATAYHRGFLTLMIFTFLLMILLVLSEVPEHLIYVWLHLIKGLDRAQIVAWYERVMEQHAIAHYAEAYKDRIPAPCLRSGVDGCYYLQTVEMTAPDKEKRILFIPFPAVGSRQFMRDIGRIAATCDGIILEGVPLESLATLPPAAYFPMKDADRFGPVKLHHRYWHILDGKKEPPHLLAGGRKRGYLASLTDGMVPFAVKALYRPHYSHTDREEAKTGWGRIKEAIEDPSVATIAVPWTVRQISNLESSLLRHGWTLRVGPKIKWLDPKEPGNNFCDFFGIPGGDGKSVPAAAVSTRTTAAAPAAAAASQTKPAR